MNAALAHSHLLELAAAHRFTLEELANNRRGALHVDQLRRFEKQGTLWLVAGAVALAGAVIAAVTVLSLGPALRSPLAANASLRRDLLRPIFIAVTVGALPTFFGWLFLRAGRRLREIVATSVVEGRDGPLTKQVRRLGRSRVHEIVVGDARLRVSPSAFSVTKEGQRYRIYFVRTAGVPVLLSLEPV